MRRRAADFIRRDAGRVHRLLLARYLFVTAAVAVHALDPWVAWAWGERLLGQQPVNRIQQDFRTARGKR